MGVRENPQHFEHDGPRCARTPGLKVSPNLRSVLLVVEFLPRNFGKPLILRRGTLLLRGPSNRLVVGARLLCQSSEVLLGRTPSTAPTNGLITNPLSCGLGAAAGTSCIGFFRAKLRARGITRAPAARGIHHRRMTRALWVVSVCRPDRLGRAFSGYERIPGPVVRPATLKLLSNEVVARTSMQGIAKCGKCS